MRRLLPFAALALVLAADGSALAQSLYQRGRANHVALIADNRARRVGDIVTIVVSERQKVEDDQEVKMSKSTSAQADIQQFAPYPELTEDVVPLAWSSNRTFDGKAESDREGRFETRITATVVDVQPNGNLVVEGRRRVVLNDDEKFMTITGLVRPYDVTATNSVASELVANATVRYESCGPLSSMTEKGWFERLVDFIWPF